MTVNSQNRLIQWSQQKVTAPLTNLSYEVFAIVHLNQNDQKHLKVLEFWQCSYKKKNILYNLSLTQR